MMMMTTTAAAQTSFEAACQEELAQRYPVHESDFADFIQEYVCQRESDGCPPKNIPLANNNTSSSFESLPTELQRVFVEAICVGDLTDECLVESKNGSHALPLDQVEAVCQETFPLLVSTGRIALSVDAASASPPTNATTTSPSSAPRLRANNDSSTNRPTSALVVPLVSLLLLLVGLLLLTWCWYKKREGGHQQGTTEKFRLHIQATFSHSAWPDDDASVSSENSQPQHNNNENIVNSVRTDNHRGSRKRRHGWTSPSSCLTPLGNDQNDNDDTTTSPRLAVLLLLSKDNPVNVRKRFKVDNDDNNDNFRGTNVESDRHNRSFHSFNQSSLVPLECECEL